MTACGALLGPHGPCTLGWVPDHHILSINGKNPRKSNCRSSEGASLQTAVVGTVMSCDGTLHFINLSVKASEGLSSRMAGNMKAAGLLCDPWRSWSPKHLAGKQVMCADCQTPSTWLRLLPTKHQTPREPRSHFSIHKGASRCSQSLICAHLFKSLHGSCSALSQDTHKNALPATTKYCVVGQYQQIGPCKSRL